MPTLEEIRAAQRRLQGIAIRTPLVECDSLLLKAESLQPIGAFKIRGAYNLIARIPPEVRARGVVAYSSGNHAQGVAYAARAFGIAATIVMPDNAPAIKVEATRALGARIVTCGAASEERRLTAERIAEETGATIVPPFDHPHIIAGAATCGAEIAEQLPEIDLLLCPVSGGGLLSGCAAAIKQLKPTARVIGVEPELAADAQQSFRTGERVTWATESTSRTIADGLRTQSVGAHPFELIRRYVDDIITVTEDEILHSMARIATCTTLTAEPSGAVAAAGWFFGREKQPAANHPVAIVSGGNADPEILARAMHM